MKLYLSFFILTLSVCCFSQTKCDAIKEGTFYYPSLPTKITVREKNIQKSFSDGVLEAVWKVEWINSCKYIIVCTEIHNKELPIEIGDKIIVTVLDVDESCYYSSLEVYTRNNPDGLTISDKPFPLCWESE